MKIGLLICGAMSKASVAAHGDYTDLYKELLGGQGFEFESWNVFEGDLPDTAEAADGWLVSGSKHGAYDALPWIAPLEEFIRDCVDAARPIVGICFGHQIIAQALGGTVEKYSGGWNVGRKTYDFAGLDLAMMAWHQDQVTAIPEGVHVLASNETCQYAALLYGDRALTLQPHPEFDAESVEILADVNAGNVPQDILDAVTEDLNEPIASEVIADQISDFYRLPRSA
ncbi:type 1 glutamine amidotransferase [Cognatishimia sp.]|uniref:type 1 glutamine amidotransferase n=1 Tax=Cognatishimia sp. TaxID=2211648 RepID=UPI003518C8B9